MLMTKDKRYPFPSLRLSETHSIIDFFESLVCQIEHRNQLINKNSQKVLTSMTKDRILSTTLKPKFHPNTFLGLLSVNVDARALVNLKGLWL